MEKECGEATNVQMHIKYIHFMAVNIDQAPNGEFIQQKALKIAMLAHAINLCIAGALVLC